MAQIKKKSPKKTTSKKTTTKKVEKIIIDTTPNDEMEAALDAIEEGAKQAVVNEIEEQLESDNIPFGKEEGNSWDDPKVYETKEDFKEVDQDPPMEVMNGDAAVLTPTDEIEEEAMKETFKGVKENKSRKLNGDPFTYSWNGIEIDYIL